MKRFQRKRAQRTRVAWGDSKGTDRKGKCDSDEEEDMGGGWNMSLSQEERIPSAIIPRIRHVGRIAHRWALGLNVSIENTSARGAIGSIKMEHGAK